MAIGGISRAGNARNNFLYGSQGRDSLDGGAGDDYLRGYEGNDVLAGGTGADRFVFERTFAANGTDRITDFEVGTDILDFSLVGFARGVFNRQPLANIIRLEQTDTGARLLLDLDGGGDSFQPWARLDGLELGDQVTLRVGALTLTAPVQLPEVLSFGVSGPAQLAITAGTSAVAQLYVQGSGTPGVPMGGSVNLVANVPGMLNVAAQAGVTVAELRLSGPGTTGAAADTLVYLGTNGNDAITGSDQADIIFGFDGADTLIGGVGSDSLLGGAGNDLIQGASDDALIDGGTGLADVLEVAASYAQSNDARLLDIETVRAQAGSAPIHINLTGQTEGFRIEGNDGANALTGGAGADTLDGGAGADTYGIAQSGFSNWDTITVTDGDVLRWADSSWSGSAPVIPGVRSAVGDYGNNGQLMAALEAAIGLPGGINRTYLVRVQDNQTTPGTDFSGYYLVSEFAGSTSTLDTADIVVKLVGVDDNASISFTGVDTLLVSLG